MVQPILGLLVAVLTSLLQDPTQDRLSVVIDTRQAQLNQIKDIWNHLALQDRNLTINLFFDNSEANLQATTILEFANLLQLVPASPSGLLYSTVLTACNDTRQVNSLLVMTNQVTDDSSAEEKKKSLFYLTDKHIKVHTIWLEKNVSGAGLLLHLTNTTGGIFFRIEATVHQEDISRGIRWPLDGDTRADNIVQTQTSAAVIDPAVPQKLTIPRDTGAQRRSEQDKDNFRIINWKPNIPLTVEVNEQSTLYAQPGQTVTLTLEITNNYDRQLFFYYYCTTMYSEVVNIQPSWGWVQGGETVIVQIILRVGNNLQATHDTILFTASGAYTMAKKVYLYFGTPVEDGNKPEFSYKVNGNCNGVDQPSLCEGTSWNLQATVQDKDSGLLKVTSLPEGIIVPSDFIVGTKDSVNVRYTSTCCFPKVDLIATDINGNRYKKSIDVNDIWLSTGSIIAIVLGVILLIVIIIVVIFIVVRLCIRRRRRLSFRTNN